MSQGDDDSEESHEPSQKKLDDARKKGEIARSTDLTTAASYGGFLIAITTVGASQLSQLGNVFGQLIGQSDSLSTLIFDGSNQPTLGGIGSRIIILSAALFLFPAVFALASILGQRSFIVTPDKLAFKLSRVSLLSNAKNKFGRAGLFEFAKSFIKLMTISLCLALFLQSRFDFMVASLQSEPAMIMAGLGQVCIEFLFVVLLITLFIGVLDYLFQHAEHRRKNMMSHKDMRDEHKEAEGDPHMKQHRRSRAQEIALTQMMADVPSADVILVNPTHYAVALKWSRLPGAAPVCVAKGVDEIAARIREIARENGVPIHSDPPTARALHATVEIGQEIKPEHFRAVAAAVRFAEAMRKRAKGTRA